MSKQQINRASGKVLVLSLQRSRRLRFPPTGRRAAAHIFQLSILVLVPAPLFLPRRIGVGPREVRAPASPPLWLPIAPCITLSTTARLRPNRRIEIAHCQRKLDKLRVSTVDCYTGPRF